MTNDVRYEHCTSRTAFASSRVQVAMSVADGPPTTNRRSVIARPVTAPQRRRSARTQSSTRPWRSCKSDGLEAVTMRRVAAALDTGAASLYVYVSGREGLLQAMLDRVTATIELEAPDPARWRAQLHSLLRRMHQALVAHPGMAALTLEDPPTTEVVLRRDGEPAGNPARRRRSTPRTPPGRATSSCCW